MLTLDVMHRIELSGDPFLHRLLPQILRANFAFRPTRTRIDVESADRVPRDRQVFFAMNHTDRFNYLPFYVAMYDREFPVICTWVKGKYFQNPLLRDFLAAVNQLPAPSKGYLITADAQNVLGEPPDPTTYRVLRDAVDAREKNPEALLNRARDANRLDVVEPLVETPRDMLGLRFDPVVESYVAAQRRLFAEMMEAFVALNHQAFDLGCNILVFPEGTRSRRLREGHTGLAQMAIRMGATVVPVGCHGSDEAYPGSNPFSRGGRVMYRFGEPLRPEAELAEFQTDDAFRPFTDEAADAHGERFEAMTALVMDRLNEVLDPAYQRRDDPAEGIEGAERFV
jgi:1-acyl-sn-glycerol-3-phosphate acyltransferase